MQISPPEAPALSTRTPPETASPCVDICALDEAGTTCLGCHRTLDEIAAWSGLTPAQRRAIMADLPARGARAAARGR